MTKGKHATDPLADLQFVSALQLEEALDVLSSLASPRTPITLTQLDADTWQFDMAYQRGAVPIAQIQGTLRRWQGTLTRLNAAGEVRRTEIYLSRQVYMVEVILGLAILGGGVLMTLNGLWFGMIVVGIGVGIAWGRWGLHFEDQADEHTLTRVQFRERDALFQRIIAAFQRSGQVAYDDRQLMDGEIIHWREGGAIR
jgi:hypothetical protein